jgi:hypothetical protein
MLKTAGVVFLSSSKLNIKLNIYLFALNNVR